LNPPACLPRSSARCSSWAWAPGWAGAHRPTHGPCHEIETSHPAARPGHSGCTGPVASPVAIEVYRMTAASAPQHLVIATRASRLALWQARHVQSRLQALYPGCRVELLEMTTRGDQILDRTLSKVGGKGLFVKE